MAAPVIGHLFHFLIAYKRTVDAFERTGIGLVEHVTLAQQLLGTLLAKDRAAINAAGDVETDAGWQIGLDDAGDHIDGRALRRHDKMDARSTALLRKALDQHLDFLTNRHHQIGQFVNDQNNLWQDLVIELLFLDYGLARFGIVAGLHGTL